MMADEYIKREDALASIRREDPAFAYTIERVPAANVRPVVRGEWIWNNDNGFYYCSNCKAISPREDQDGEYCDCPAFCHVCGADMRGDTDDS